MESRKKTTEALCYLRNPSAVIVLTRTGIIYLRDNDRALRRLDFGEKHELVSRVLSAVRVPVSMECLRAEIQEGCTSLEEVVECLVSQKLVLCGPSQDLDRVLAPTLNGDFAPVCRRIIVGVCGSIYAAQVVPLILFLKNFVAANVEVVLTEGAQKFLRREVFGFYGIQAWTDAYETRGDIRVPHIHLADACDLLLVLPASASFLHRAATGGCSDLLSLLVTTIRAPIVMVPAMNRLMASNFAVRSNIERLRREGVYIVEPNLGFEASADKTHMSFSGIALKDTTLMQLVAGLLKVHK